MKLLDRIHERRQQRRAEGKKGSVAAIWLVIDLIWILIQLAFMQGGKK